MNTQHETGSKISELHNFGADNLSIIQKGIFIYIQWNLQIKDNLGPGILSLVRRLVSLGGQPIFSLKMP